MQYSKLPALTLRLTLLSATLAFGLSACASQPLVIRPATSCTELLPDEYAEDVPSAKIPFRSLEVGDWVAFGDAQTGQLDKANLRAHTSVAVIKKCENRDAALAKQLAPRGWLRRLWPF